MSTLFTKYFYKFSILLFSLSITLHVSCVTFTIMTRRRGIIFVIFATLHYKKRRKNKGFGTKRERNVPNPLFFAYIQNRFLDSYHVLDAGNFCCSIGIFLLSHDACHKCDLACDVLNCYKFHISECSLNC